MLSFSRLRCAAATSNCELQSTGIHFSASRLTFHCLRFTCEYPLYFLCFRVFVVNWGEPPKKYIYVKNNDNSTLFTHSTEKTTNKQQMQLAAARVFPTRRDAFSIFRIGGGGFRFIFGGVEGGGRRYRTSQPQLQLAIAIATVESPFQRFIFSDSSLGDLSFGDLEF